ncbi:MAG TPA: EAL domain-containing protein [Polyangiaceae bacterium]|nr:EAL domain-containing protein [Polyangiaceae bacterium]
MTSKVDLRAAEEPSDGTPSRGSALVVDDDDCVRKTTARLLSTTGYAVVEAVDGEDALRNLEGRRFDVVISDISMPGMDGIRLLKEIRARDRHVQVILMTGVPTVETAVSALDFGAFKYLSKPFQIDVLDDAVGRAVRLSRLARMESRAAALAGTSREQVADALGLEVAFERALASAYLLYQPIVDGRTGSAFGQEALVRSREPGFETPAALLSAAERLDRLPDLGRLVRRAAAVDFAGSGEGLLFVNLHPADLTDPELYAPNSELHAISSRVVLEITERSSIHRVPDSAARVATLRQFGFRVAVDDLGAGYAGLSSFAHLHPDFVKLDMSLVRDIHRDDTKRRIVAAMTQLASELSMSVIGEGVETEGEGETLRDLGCSCLQGFLYSEPGPAFPGHAWPHGRRDH